MQKRFLRKILKAKRALAVFVFMLSFITFFGVNQAQAAADSGVYTSGVIDLGVGVNYYGLSWSFTVPGGMDCSGGTAGVCAALQIATANSPSPASGWGNDNGNYEAVYMGPSGPASYFTTSGEVANATVQSFLNGKRYVRYKIFLYTQDTTLGTPILSSVTINYQGYPLSAMLESSSFDSKNPFNTVSSISWDQSVPSGSQIKMQIKTSSNNSSWNTSSSYSCVGSSCSFPLNISANARYFKYVATLLSQGGPPTFTSVSVGYDNSNSPYFESNIINFGHPVEVGNISWTAASTSGSWSDIDTSCNIVNGSECAVKIQVAGSASGTGPWSYIGPDGTSNSYFTATSGGYHSLPSNGFLNNNTYFKYRVFLSSINPTTASPLISNVGIGCASCTTPGYIESSIYDGYYSTNALDGVTFTNANTANIPGEAVKFQFHTSPDRVNWTPWCGPDDGDGNTTTCDTTTYFTGQGESFDDMMRDGVDDEFFQYRMFLQEDAGGKPLVNNVSVSYLKFGDDSTLSQNNYRFYEPIDSNQVMTPSENENTPLQLTQDSQPFRLRMLVHVTGVDLNTSIDYFKLQYSKKSGSCDAAFSGENYKDITTTSDIAFYQDNFNVVDRDPLAENTLIDPTSTYAKVPQTYEEANNVSVITKTLIGQDAMWDFSLQDLNAPANNSYCFRLVKKSGAGLAVYTQIPEVKTKVELNTNYSWLQSDWTGGITANTWSHANEVLNPGTWLQYSSLNSDISAGSNVTMQDRSNQIKYGSTDPLFSGSGTGTVIDTTNNKVKLQSN